MSLRLDAISHDYGSGPVIDTVTVEVEPGSVHALLGMNGAGKSTLMHIAAGAFAPTSGRITIDGEAVELSKPGEAERRGVVLLAQEVDRALVPTMTVHENLTVALLRREGARRFSAAANRARATALLAEYGISLDVNRLASSLSIYEKQIVSLVRAVSADARYILLDEPTASFDRRESERFYAIVDALRASGIGMVFISHKLAEVFTLSDRISVLRGGRLVLESATAASTVDAVVEAMTGAVSRAGRRTPREAAGEPLFVAEGLSLGAGGADRADRADRAPLSLRLGRGEIVVVFGLLASGKTSLARALFGFGRPYTADIGGTRVRIASPAQAARAGLAYVPEERRRHGVWAQESIGTHFSLQFSGLINRRRESAHATRLIADFAVHPQDQSHLAGRLSGGNQQKVAIAKWFGKQHRLALFDEPMKGIDVAAKEAIFQMIERTASGGTAVLYLTAEPDDALRIADRVLVLTRAGFVRELTDPAGLTPADVMRAADEVAEAAELADAHTTQTHPIALKDQS